MSSHIALEQLLVQVDADHMKSDCRVCKVIQQGCVCAEADNVHQYFQYHMV